MRRKEKFRISFIIIAICIVINAIVWFTWYENKCIRGSAGYVFCMQKRKDSSQPEFVMSFIELLNEYKIDVFVTEPMLVFEFLNEKKQKLLIERRFVTKSGYNLKESFNFGIKKRHLHQLFNKSFIEATEKLGFTLTVHRHEGTSSIIDRLRSKVTLVHIFYTKGAVNIQVTVFYGGNAWYWVGAVDRGVLRKGIENLYFGTNQQLFDSFSIRKTTIEEKFHIKIVEDAKFLFNLKYSKLVWCDEKMAQILSNVNVDADRDDKSLVTRTVEAIKIAAAISDEYLVPLFLFSGSQLGWYRHCGFNAFDWDMDFATYGHFASYEMTERMRAFIMKYNYTVLETFGLPKIAYQLRFASITVRNYNGFDLSYIYKMKNRTNYYAYHNPVIHAFKKLMYSKEAFNPLCSSLLFGYKVLVPCSPKKFLEEEYGVTEWSIPFRSMKFYSKSVIVYWKRYEIGYVYQCLGIGNKTVLKRSPKRRHTEKFVTKKFIKRYKNWNATGQIPEVKRETKRCKRINRLKDHF